MLFALGIKVGTFVGNLVFSGETGFGFGDWALTIAICIGLYFEFFDKKGE